MLQVPESDNNTEKTIPIPKKTKSTCFLLSRLHVLLLLVVDDVENVTQVVVFKQLESGEGTLRVGHVAIPLMLSISLGTDVFIESVGGAYAIIHAVKDKAT